MLPDAEHARLIADFETVEKEQIGEGEHERIHKLVHDWHAKYAGKQQAPVSH